MFYEYPSLECHAQFDNDNVRRLFDPTKREINMTMKHIEKCQIAANKEKCFMYILGGGLRREAVFGRDKQKT